MAGPMLKFKNEEKLHISKGPGIKSWSILVGLLIVGMGLAIYIADSTITKSVSILTCLVFGLICMDEWEDCVMDRYQDQVTLTRCNWYDRLCCRVPETNTRVLPLSNIIGVQSMGQEGLYFVLTSGSSAAITRHPIQHRQEISLTNQISSFLRLNHIEPVVENLEYDIDEWGDAGPSESPGSETGSTEGANTSVPSILRHRDEIKVLSEPPQLNQE